MDRRLPQDLLDAAAVWGSRLAKVHAEQPFHPGFDQVGMLDGHSVINDYVEHCEFGLAAEHLLYMVHEMGVDWSPHDVARVHVLAMRAGVRSRYPLAVDAAVPDRKSGFRLYLDFDGVLNNRRFLRHQRNTLPRGEHRLFDEENLAALERLCVELPVGSIVVTSTWREGRSVGELRALLEGEGFRYAALVEDVTGSGGSRVDEILEHAGNDQRCRYLVLDDMNLMPLARPEFFRVSAAVGLDELFVTEVLEALH